MTAPHEASPRPPSEAPRPPQTTASFAPGPGFVVALVVIVRSEGTRLNPVTL